MSTPNTVLANMNFTVPPSDGSPLYIDLGLAAKGTVPHKNAVEETKQVEIENVRGEEGEYTLDQHGFQFFKSATSVESFTDSERVKREYYPEVQKVLRDVTGAGRIVIFDHTIRQRAASGVDGNLTKQQPASLAHIDQTPAASIARVHQNIPAAEVPVLLKKRFQLINLWRPITNIALDWPLAVCDYQSVDLERDVMPLKLIRPGQEDGETFAVRFNGGQRWKYLRGMERDEGVLLKCYDSAEGVATYTPHTAFSDPSTPKDAPYRARLRLGRYCSTIERACSVLLDWCVYNAERRSSCGSALFYTLLTCLLAVFVRLHMIFGVALYVASWRFQHHSYMLR
ncbi:hypothetical protein BDV98DRAFT_548891 [Pterulicium gracile]|uniref:Uncharacterized protein n=1 Tax=Pterulicium gracile TaxID=1884261 RepID=A0A5C3QSL4_9AGAR|nr:hypothetical protein BDV98DRAFT_548891 [Pterula gracilis]